MIFLKKRLVFDPLSRGISVQPGFAGHDRYTNRAANTCNDRADASPVNEPVSR